MAARVGLRSQAIVCLETLLTIVAGASLVATSTVTGTRVLLTLTLIAIAAMPSLVAMSIGTGTREFLTLILVVATVPAYLLGRRVTMTFAASASRVPTTVLAPAPLVALVKGELNEAQPHEVNPALAG